MGWSKYFTVIGIATASSVAGGWSAGCGGTSTATPSDAGANVDGTSSPDCPACVQDSDCGGGVCAQVAGDSFCMPTCPHGNECSPDRACTPVTTSGGAQASACVPRSAACGGAPPDQDAGMPPVETCGALVGPDVKAACACSAGQTCAANGCYGGWWCNTATSRCQSPPSGCASADAGVAIDAGGPVTSTIGPDGGTSSRLYFAIVGDTRPANIDDTAGYPTAIITKIWSDMAALSPMPPFTVSTGDYQFSSPSGSVAATQLDLYLAARAKYPGITFPAMGNHECTGATASNCGVGTANGTTNNYTSYVSKMLSPIGKADPYYEIDVDAPDRSWTSKFVFVAANAWTSAQATWLETTLAKPTTYTFIVRHEAAAANTAPGVTPSEQIMAQHPYTLAIVGHTHTYSHYAGSREVIVGNGGAPLTGSKNFGFGLVNQRVDGAITVDMIDYTTGLADSRFHFAVKADGSAAP